MQKNMRLLLIVGTIVLGAALLLAAAVFLFGKLMPFGCVGVMPISGPLVTSDIPSSVFSDGIEGSETIAERIKAADERLDIKAIVFVVDSGGGSVVASQEIYEAINATKKPTITYLHEIAASGGYYVIAGTDYIFANPLSITGSIGVRSTFTDMSELFWKVGYNETTIKSGKYKDMGSPSRPMSDEEIAIMQSIVDESFAQFKSIVQAGRGSRLDNAGFQEILDARLITGRQAKEIGLVDALGNKQDAIDYAGQKAGLGKNPPVCELGNEPRPSILGAFGSAFASNLAQQGMPKLTFS
jgi:protease-4